MEQLAPFWEKLLGKQPDKTQSDRAAWYQLKLKLLANLPAPVRTGAENASLSRDELFIILKPFASELSSSLNAKLIRFLAKGLRAGKKTCHWRKIAIPATLFAVKREPPRFSPPKFHELQRLRLIEPAFYATLANNNLPPEERLGQLLISAIFYGGLLHTKWLQAWLEGICSEKYRIGAGMIWLDMQRTWRHSRDERGDDNKRSAEPTILMTRRWFADPLTGILLARWHQHHLAADLPASVPNAPGKLIHRFLERHCLNFSDQTPSLKSLLEMAATNCALSCSPFLTSYASGDIQTVSLPAETWARLWSGMPISRRHAPPINEGESIPSRQQLVAVADSSMLLQQTYLLQLRRIFSKGKKRRSKGTSPPPPSGPPRRNDLKAFLESHHGQLVPVIQLLASWLDYSVWAGQRIKVITVSRYMVSIASRLLAVCGDENLLEWRVEDFFECYDRVIELVDKEQEKSYARKTLGRFHEHLVRYFGAVRLPRYYFASSSGPPEVRVSANLISMIEFDRIKSALGWGDPDQTRMAKASLLAALLGFRCGLRRNEVRYLRIRDFHWGRKPELVLRATTSRSLKSPCATRRLPLHILLLPEELTYCHDWLYNLDDGPDESLLFSMAKNPLVPLGENDIFNPVSTALHLVTFDETLTFHHLRHSFATWLLIRLAGVPELGDKAPFLKHSEFTLERITDLRNELLGNDTLGRKGAYAVSALCGHADLSTTFTSYIHLCDWLLGHEWTASTSLPKGGVEAIQTLTNLSRASLYRMSRSSPEPGSVRLWNWPAVQSACLALPETCTDPLTAVASPYSAVTVEFPPDPDVPSLWRPLHKALVMRQNKKSISEISRRTMVDEGTIKRWFETALEIGMKKDTYSAGSRYYRHQELSVYTDGKDLPPRVGGCNPIKKKLYPELFPTVPHLNADIELAMGVLDRFSKLTASDQQEVLELAQVFVNRFTLRTRTISFRKPELVKTYIATLSKIGIASTMIRLVAFPHSKEENRKEAERRKQWEAALGETFKWRIHRKLQRPVPGMGIIGVDVTLKYGKGAFKGAYGFRYAIYLLAICSLQ